jgi:hypothetical protein
VLERLQDMFAEVMPNDLGSELWRIMGAFMLTPSP